MFPDMRINTPRSSLISLVTGCISQTHYHSYQIKVRLPPCWGMPLAICEGNWSNELISSASSKSCLSGGALPQRYIHFSADGYWSGMMLWKVCRLGRRSWQQLSYPNYCHWQLSISLPCIPISLWLPGRSSAQMHGHMILGHWVYTMLSHLDWTLTFSSLTLSRTLFAIQGTPTGENTMLLFMPWTMETYMLQE